MPIRVLAPDVSSKIAAGEVVERPASVVKELVENALDAGATEVSIETRGGGVELIRVADNGSGIPSDDAELAFLRFATSKVSAAHDLGAISTLGFRGEALHAIAAVSSVTLVTRTATEESGTSLGVENGEVVRREPHAAAPGTSVVVRGLFRDFPARRNFLRSVATEASRIHAWVTRCAMAYPEVRFRFNEDRSSAFSSPGSGDLRDVVSSVYGPDVAQAMLELSANPSGEDTAGHSVSGMIGPPSVDRANRTYMSFFVNRRWVQNRMLGYALEQAYHGFLKEGRRPIAAVNVVVPLDEVDVNVHPAKAEVRFRQENRVFSALQQTVRNTLLAESPVPGARRGQALSPGAAGQPRGPNFWPSRSLGDAAHVPNARDHPTGGPASAEPSHAQPMLPSKALPALRVLGQVQSTYVAAEGPDGMYLIDQHAAHERVLFEKVTASAASREPQGQSLLEPATVELSPRQQEVLESQEDLMSRLGLRYEPFGERTYLLRAVPSLLDDSDPSQALLDVLDLMAEGGGFESWEERAAYSIACHGAIRAGKNLSTQEMTELARQLEECQQPHTCPHGRPTMIHLSSGHLEREFGRR